MVVRWARIGRGSILVALLVGCDGGNPGGEAGAEASERAEGAPSPRPEAAAASPVGAEMPSGTGGAAEGTGSGTAPAAPDAQGFVVANPSGPLPRLGVLAGDVLLSVNGNTLDSPLAIRAAVQQLLGEQPQQASVRRGSSEIELAWEPFVPSIPSEGTGIEASSEIDFVVHPASFAELASQPADEFVAAASVRMTPLEVDGAWGFRMSGIRRDSLASALGFRNSDVLLDIGGQPMEHPYSLYRAIHALAPGGVLEVHVLRRGEPVTLTYRAVE